MKSLVRSINKFEACKVLSSLNHLASKIPRSNTTSSSSATKSNLDVNGTNHVRPFEDIPEVKALPFIGSLLDYTPLRGFDLKNIFKLYQKRHEEYGDIFKEKVVGKYIVGCRTREDTEAMFRYEGRFPMRQDIPALQKIRKELNMTDSFSILGGEEWYKFRKVVNPLLLQNKMVWQYVEPQQNVCKDVMKYIKNNLDENGEVPDFQTVLSRWSFEMAAAFILNTRLGLFHENFDPMAEKILKDISIMMDFVANSLWGIHLWKYYNTKELKLIFMIIWSKLSPRYRFYSLESQVLQAQLDIIESMKIITAKSEKSKEGERKTVMELILESTTLTEEERFVLLFDVLGAAVDTTSNAAALIMYCLTISPEHQEKLREEVMKLPKELTGRVVDNCQYLNAFVKEATRLYPLTFFLSRVYDKDVVLSGYRIPEGTTIINTSNSTQNRNPQYFPEPDSFLPERWLKSSNVETLNNKFTATGPFGFGPRTCPGRRFAMQEIRLLLIEIVKHFKVEYHHEPIVSIFRATGMPSEKPRFKFVPLEQ